MHPKRLYRPTSSCSRRPKHTARSRVKGASPTSSFQARFDTNIANFMDLVEAAKHYPCVKRAWVEYLGEHPDPVIDRV